MTHWNLRWKLNAALLVATAVALFAASFLTYKLASTAAHDMAIKMAYDKLQATRSTKAIEVERYFATVRNQLAALTDNLMVIHAMEDFSRAAQDLHEISPAQRAKLAAYYQQDFFSQYRKHNPDAKQADIAPLLNQLDGTAMALQYRYIAANEHSLGNKALMNATAGKNRGAVAASYDDYHQQYHPYLRKAQHHFGLSDLLLVEPIHGRVVYSVSKRLDFGTRLTEGPWAHTGLAQAYQQGLHQTQDIPTITDFSPYTPSYNLQAMFASIPIYSKGKLLGVLVAQLSVDAIDKIMTNDHVWLQSGDGKTGQSLLVGADYRLRSDSRFRYQDESAYLQALARSGVGDTTIAAIRGHHNTVGQVKYENMSVRSALKGNEGVGQDQNSRGGVMISAYQPLKIPGLHWMLISEMDKSEAVADVVRFKQEVKRDIALLIAALLMLVFFWALYFSRRITRPLQAVTGQLHALSQGKIEHTVIDYHSHDEIGQLIAASAQLDANLQHTVDQAQSISQGDFGYNLKVMGDDDALGQALLQMNQMLRNLASTAGAIAEGDYSGTIVLRSERDQLGKSLQKMMLSLRLASEASAAQNWLQSSLAEISAAIQGKAKVESLAETVMTLLSAKLGIPCATLFVKQESVELPGRPVTPGEMLLCRGHYACSDQHLNHAVAFGEGLVGQCAHDLQIITIDDVPADYMRAISSLGDAAPSMVTAVPLLADGVLAGVMELASFRPFSEMEAQLIRQLAPLLGMAIRSLQQAQKTEALLEESQAMSEELQAQEEELREANAMLELQTESLESSKKQLEDQAQSLVKKADDLAQASQYKSEFLANMSHELRTPLNSLLILSDMLASNKDGNMNAKQLEYARTINGSGKDLLELINSILDLAKVEAGKMSIDPQPFALSDISASMQRDFAHVAQNAGVEFVIHLAADLPETMFSDVMRIKQILKNLLSNAFKFVSSKGTVTLNIERSGSEAVCFDVCDTGIGIMPEKLEHIFAAFHQEDGSTSRKYGGTGLGLSICRELSHLLKGAVSVESEQGKGSTFSLTIPVRCDVAVEPAMAASPDLASSQGGDDLPPDGLDIAEIPNPLHDDRDHLVADKRSILIIEDDQRFAALLQSLVHEHGYQAINALRGDHGWWLARQLQPDAVLLDLQLPYMDGSVVLDNMKQNVSTRHIPVHVISCMDQANCQWVMQHGALSFLQKTAQKEELDGLLDHIEVFLNRKMKRLLIVEDDEIQNRALRELLIDPAVEIVSQTRGYAALDYLRGHHVDCMILDLHLPDIEGEALLALMEQESDQINEGQPVPVILHTASDMEPDAAERIQKDVRSIIVKGAYSSERLLAETYLFLHHLDREGGAEQSSATGDNLSGRTVLLVDDDVRNRFSLSSFLDAAELTVHTARNGVEAIDALKQYGDAIDLVLMDIMMPEMDGFEAMRRIRQMDAFRQLPIIALTAKAMSEDREQCIAAGASDFITKPIDTQQLMSLIKVWLHG